MSICFAYKDSPQKKSPTFAFCVSIYLSRMEVPGQRSLIHKIIIVNTRFALSRAVIANTKVTKLIIVTRLTKFKAVIITRLTQSNIVIVTTRFTKPKAVILQQDLLNPRL